jgi:UDP-N-acetylglucosamine acyltransferase
MSIHPTAIVHPKAVLAWNVEVGPYCVVEAGTCVESGTQLAAHVVVKTGTRIGADNRIGEHAVLGGLPQHIAPPGPPGGLLIGDGNILREYVTMHRSLYENGATIIGSGGMYMAGAHVAHDCVVGDRVVLANNVLLAGHVHVGDRVFFGGAAAVQQFCRVGRLAMVGGMARITQDVPPFMLVDGGSTMVVGLNRVGLKRAGFSREEIAELKLAYRTVYRKGLNWSESAEQLVAEFASALPREVAEFLKSGQRGFLQERRTPPGAVLRVFSNEAAAESKRIAG